METETALPEPAEEAKDAEMKDSEMKEAEEGEEDVSSSDVEIEGVDMDADEEEAVEEDEDEKASSNADEAAVVEENEEEIDALETEEINELEEARKEQMELMAAEQKKAAEDHKPATAQERLEYLLAQSDVFAHFLAGTKVYSITRLDTLEPSSFVCSLIISYPFFVAQVRWPPLERRGKRVHVVKRDDLRKLKRMHSS